MEYVILAISAILFGLIFYLFTKPSAKPAVGFIFCLISIITLAIPIYHVLTTGESLTGEFISFNNFYIRANVSALSVIPMIIAALTSFFVSLRALNDKKYDNWSNLAIPAAAYLCLSVDGVLFVKMASLLVLVFALYSLLKKSVLFPVQMAISVQLILFAIFHHIHKIGMISPIIIYSGFIISILFIAYALYRLLKFDNNKTVNSVRIVNYAVIMLEAFAVLSGFLYGYPSLIVFVSIGLGMHIISGILYELFVINSDFNSPVEESILLGLGLYVPVFLSFTGMLYSLSGYYTIVTVNFPASILLMILSVLVFIISIFTFIKHIIFVFDNRSFGLIPFKVKYAEYITQAVILAVIILFGIYPKIIVKALYVPISLFITGQARYDLLKIVVDEALIINRFILLLGALLLLYLLCRYLYKKIKLNAQ